MKVTLDTHTLLQLTSGELSKKRMTLLADPDCTLLISSISLWEIAKLSEFERIEIEGGLLRYLNQIVENPRYLVHDLTPFILATVIDIAPKMHRDPADQIIVATAIANKAALLTDDRLIRKQGLVTIV